jgi:hypothetical protein
MEVRESSERCEVRGSCLNLTLYFRFREIVFANGIVVELVRTSKSQRAMEFPDPDAKTFC